MKVKIRKGDQVEIVTGRTEDKGKRGEVIKVLPEEQRIVVQGINMHTKHQRQVQSQGRTVNPGKIRYESDMKRSSAWRYLWKSEDIRKKLIITVLLLVLYRLAANIPVPGIDRSVILSLANSTNTAAANLFNMHLFYQE